MRCFFDVPGEAKGKARPKSTIINGHSRVYTPAKQIEYENWVRLCFFDQYPEAKEGPLFKEGHGVAISITIHRKMPASFSKKKKNLMNGRGCLTKPDADNVAKSICDALNGIAYHDDAQIYKVCVRKVWSHDASHCSVSLFGEEEKLL